MTNLNIMENRYATLTEEELGNVDGGFAITITVASLITAGKIAGTIVTVGGGLYGAGYAIGNAWGHHHNNKRK